MVYTKFPTTTEMKSRFLTGSGGLLWPSLLLTALACMVLHGAADHGRLRHLHRGGGPSTDSMNTLRARCKVSVPVDITLDQQEPDQYLHALRQLPHCARALRGREAAGGCSAWRATSA